MPWSSGVLRAIGIEHITALNPRTILDVGAGAGTWQTWYRDARWTAIEVWEPYIKQYGLRDRYVKVIRGDARWCELGGPYDLAIIGDVLEHVEGPLYLYERIRGVARSVLVQIPVGYWPQGEEEDNPYEAHVSMFTADELRSWPGIEHFYEKDGIVLFVSKGLITG